MKDYILFGILEFGHNGFLKNLKSNIRNPKSETFTIFPKELNKTLQGGFARASFFIE
jgi:hypothetical protein